MKKTILRLLGFIVVSILILICTTSIHLNNIPKKIYTNNDEVAVMTFIPDIGILNSVKYNDDEVSINFLGLIPIKSIAVHKVEEIEVIPGGNSIGVRLSSQGVLVVGFSDVTVNQETVSSPAKSAGIEIGDIITKVNGKEVLDSKELISCINTINDDEIDLLIKRDNEYITKKFKLVREDDKKFKIGLWVRDSTAGVGTLTFYHEESGKFGALGHPVTDVDTNKCFNIRDGELLDASIISVKKGEKGLPGELKGIFVDSNSPVGNICRNTQCGIFGDYNKELCKFNKKIKVGFRDEIEIGKANIITTIDENGPKEYEIEIVKIFPQSEPSSKSMLIKVTDEELLSKTGGIVQGMSGSPIIQNGKIIGAVTHVLINKPDVGYGIYIDWMLNDADIIK